MVALPRSEDLENQALFLGKQVAQDVEQLDQHGVAGGQRDLPVERHVHRVQDVVVGEVLPRGGEQASHLSQMLRGGLLHSISDGLRLQRDAGPNEIQEQLLGHRPRVSGLASTRTSSLRLTYTPEPWRISTTPIVSSFFRPSRTVGWPTPNCFAISIIDGRRSPTR